MLYAKAYYGAKIYLLLLEAKLDRPLVPVLPLVLILKDAEERIRLEPLPIGRYEFLEFPVGIDAVRLFHHAVVTTQPLALHLTNRDK